MKRSRSRRHLLARYHEKNPSTESYVIAGVGVVLVLGLVYWLYEQNAEASESGGSSGGSGGGLLTSYNTSSISGSDSGGGAPAAISTGTQATGDSLFSAPPGGSMIPGTPNSSSLPAPVTTPPFLGE
jgi:hypothetical protein